MSPDTATAYSPHAADTHDLIRVLGARVNDLKQVSLEIQKRRLTVFTGVSGSGKSSLVFGAIAAESQRMINETYVRDVGGRGGPGRSVEQLRIDHRAMVVLIGRLLLRPSDPGRSHRPRPAPGARRRGQGVGQGLPQRGA